MNYNGKEVYSIGQNDIPMDVRIDWAWEQINLTHPEFKREQWPAEWNDPYQIYEIVVNNVCGYKPQTADVVMDIGANFGVFTAYCALNGCDVYAFEPHPVAFKMLEETVQRTGISELVFLYRLGIWKTAGLLPFVTNSGHEQGASWIWSNSSLMTDGKTIPENRELDHFRTMIFAKAVDLEPEWDCVKMDIEGAEFDVLLDASDQTLSKIKYLTVELHNGHATKEKHDALCTRLERIFSLDGTRDGDPQFKGQNRWISLFATRK